MRAPRLEHDLALALVVVACVRQGAFYPPDARLVPLGFALLAALAVARRRAAPPRDTVVAAVALVALAAWWCLRAWQDGDLASADQFAGALVAGAAVLLLASTATAEQRTTTARALLVVGVGTTVVGVVAVALQLQPLALPAQGQLRLAGTLTYSNATGCLLALLLVVALGTPAAPPAVQRSTVALLTAGLVATQSRGAVLGLVLGLVALRHLLAARLVPLVVGALAGVLVVAGSTEGPDRPWVLLALPLCLAAGLVGGRPSRRALCGGVALLVLAVVVLAAAGRLGGVPDAARNRLSGASVSDRAFEWEAALDGVRREPLVGVGPGRRLELTDGRTARFVHNEPLQVLADTGAVGAGLLLVAAGALWRGRRRYGATGRSALVVLLVAGLLDFSWHLPAVLAVAGLVVAGMPRDDEPDDVSGR